MHVDPYIVLGSAVVGFLVGMTGAGGGGALMTPMLILLFGITPSTAISSDLVAAVVMRPIGAGVHLRKATVNLALVGWMVLGSVPMAFLGAYLLHVMSHAKAAQSDIEIALGLALLIGAAAMILYFALDRRHGRTRQGVLHDLMVWPVATVIVGMIGGLIVRMSYSAAAQMQQSFTVAAATTTTTPTPSCTSVVSTTEMLTDPGFASNFSTRDPSWGDNVWGGAVVTYAPDTTDPHSGAQAQSIDVTTLGTDGGVIFEQTVTLTAGTVYQGSVWLRSPDAATVDFQLRGAGSPYETAATQRVTLTSNWQQYTIQGGFAATTSTFFGINFDSIGTVVVDDASLRELSNTDCVASTAPIPATYFGMDINKWGTYNVWPSELNFGMLRLWDTGTTWADIEPQPGVWNWTRLDYYVQTAVKNHEAIMLTLGQTPQWASSAPNDAYDGANAPPTNISDWETYIQAVATRYKGEIKYWEIWNETNNNNFYDGTPQELVTLTQTANQVLKAVDPSNVIVSPDFTTTGLGFMGQFLNDGGGQYIDVMSVHLYPGDTPEADFPFFGAVQDLMQGAGIGGTPLWNTEGASGDPTSTDQVASGLVARTYLLEWAWGVTNFDWYCWDISVGSALSEAGYITPTAAGIAYEQVARWMIGASMLNISQGSNGTWTITLQASDGSLEYAVWNVNGSTSFSIPAGWTVGSADDLTGGSTPISGSTVTIGIEPLLLVPYQYFGVGTTALGWLLLLCATLLGAGAIWLAYVRPWRNADSESGQ